MRKISLICLIGSTLACGWTGCGDRNSPSSSGQSSPHLNSQNLPNTNPSPDPNPSPTKAQTPPDPRLQQIDHYLGNFIELPAVTAAEVDVLTPYVIVRRLSGTEATTIIPMPAFRAAETKISIGLYYAVMGRYPDLTRIYPTGGELVNDGFRAQILQSWRNNPDLPLVYATVGEVQNFVAELRRLTGRPLSLMTDSQLEYSVRGRNRNPDGSWGAIPHSTYFFGEGLINIANDAVPGEVDPSVSSRAFIDTNPLTLGRTHGVHEIPPRPPGPEIANYYRNSFGIIHPVGNITTKSREGRIWGCSFRSPFRDCRWSQRVGPESWDFPNDTVGYQLSETL